MKIYFLIMLIVLGGVGCKRHTSQHDGLDLSTVDMLDLDMSYIDVDIDLPKGVKDIQDDLVVDQTIDISDSAEDLGFDREDIWDTVQNSCALLSTQVDAVIGGPVAPIASLDVQLAWSKTKLCEKLDSRYNDEEFGERVLALGQYKGQPTVGVPIIQSSLPENPGHGMKAWVWVDAKTGNVKSCEVLEDRRGVIAQPTYVNPYKSDSSLFASVTFEDGFAANLDNYPGFVRWYSSQWDESKTKLPWPITGTPPKTASFLLPDGQMVILLSGGYVVSVDAKSGVVNWTVEPKDIDDALPLEVRKQNYLTTFEHVRWDAVNRSLIVRVVAAASNGPNGSAFVSIDHCGVVKSIEHPEELVVYKQAIDGGGVEIKRQLDTAYTINMIDAAQTVFTVSGCFNVVSVAEGKFACIKRVNGRGLSALSVEVVSYPNQVSQWLLEKSEENGVSYEFDLGAVSLKERLLVFTSTMSRIVPSFKVTKNIWFVDWFDGSIKKRIDIDNPNEVQLQNFTSIPVVSDNGQLVYNGWGYLFGLQTNSKGLSSTSFPRGIILGGNNNQGPKQRVGD